MFSRFAGALILLLCTPLAHASELSDDLAARRARVMERIGPAGMLILWSAPVRNYSLDVSYEYRQDSNLYYLTGLLQDDTMLVLMPGNATRKEILFIRDRNPVREHWSGRLLSHEEAVARTGIKTVLWESQFEPFVAAMLGRRAADPIDEKEASAFFDAIFAGHARIAIPFASNGANDPLTRAEEFARRIRERFAGFETIDATPLLTSLRLIKTPYERNVLIKSLEISSEAQKAGMRAARPGAWEYEVEAAIEAVHRARGSVSASYPSIVGSGPNATILHYTESRRQMHSGELLLVDAAANYEYMSGDITRTYPVSGTFSPGQKELFTLVLQAQDDGMKAAVPGATIMDIHRKTVDVIKAGLLRLGLITDTSGEQYRIWYTHGACHYIGIDVHDVGDRNHPLEPGMSFVIEPGIYIRQEALDALPRTAANMALIQAVQPAVDKYKDIGIRIEDAFLLEEFGLRRLTSAAPRTIDEIEAFMRTRPATR